MNRLASARQVTPPCLYGTILYLHDATMPAPVSAVLLLRMLLLVMSHNGVDTASSSSSYSLLETDKTQLIMYNSEGNSSCTVTNNSMFSKYVYIVLVLQSFYQIGVHGVLAVVCRVCVFWGDSVAMLWTAVGEVRGRRGVYEKDCSMSCGTAGHQTLPAARQSPGDQDQGDSSCSACCVAEMRRLVEDRSRLWSLAMRATRTVRQPGHHDCPEDRLQADIVHTMVTQDTQNITRVSKGSQTANGRQVCT